MISDKFLGLRSMHPIPYGLRTHPGNGVAWPSKSGCTARPASLSLLPLSTKSGQPTIRLYVYTGCSRTTGSFVGGWEARTSVPRTPKACWGGTLRCTIGVFFAHRCHRYVSAARDYTAAHR